MEQVKPVRIRTGIRLNPLEYLIWRVSSPLRRVRLGYWYFRNVKSLFYRGRQVYCPCCRRSFRRFLPFQSKPGYILTGYLCPGCLSAPRHRLLWLYLERRTSLLSSASAVLHLAPEYFLQQALQRPGTLRYVSVDLRSVFAMVHADITRLPFAEETFHAILCVHVLEHIPGDRQALRELARVLKPGGWAILQVPLDERRTTTYEDAAIVTPAGREAAFGQEDHVRLYGLDYSGRLREAGFDAVADPFAASLSAADIARFGLDPEEKVFYCKKPARP